MKQSIEALVERERAAVVGEFGATDCSDAHDVGYMNWADAHAVGYLAWQWVALAPSVAVADAAPNRARTRTLGFRVS